MAGGNPDYRGDEAGGGGNPWGIPNRPSKLVTEGLGLPPEAGYLLESIPNLDVPDLHGDEAQVVSSLVNLVWIVGDFKGFVEALTGEDLITGRQLSKLDRALNLLPALARSGKLFTLAPEAKAGLVTAADAVGAASAEIRASEVARQAALKAKDVEALQISTLEKLEALDRAEEHALWWTDFAARSADRAELTTLNTELAQAATLETLKRLDRVEAALRFAGETNDPIAYLAALPQAADQVSDLGQFLEDLAQVSPGVADSDGDQRPDISVPVAQPGEVDSDGDGVPDMSALQSPVSYPASEDELEVEGEQVSYPPADPYEDQVSRPDEGNMSNAEDDTAGRPNVPSETGTPPEFDMAAYHRGNEEGGTAEPEVEPGTGPLSNEAVEQRGEASSPGVEPGTGPLSNEAVEQRGEASPPEVEPGTGPLSNEAVEQRGAADQRGSGDVMAREAGSAGQSCAPASDELSSVSGQYSPASDELDVESASAEGGSQDQQDDGPYSPASDELDVETDGRAEQVESEQVESEQVESEQVQYEQVQDEQVQDEQVQDEQVQYEEVQNEG